MALTEEQAAKLYVTRADELAKEQRRTRQLADRLEVLITLLEPIAEDLTRDRNESAVHSDLRKR